MCLCPFCCVSSSTSKELFLKEGWDKWVTSAYSQSENLCAGIIILVQLFSCCSCGMQSLSSRLLFISSVVCILISENAWTTLNLWVPCVCKGVLIAAIVFLLLSRWLGLAHLECLLRKHNWVSLLWLYYLDRRGPLAHSSFVAESNL